MLRIGHKGADLLVPGNTADSFRAAVEAGVDAIELDVLRPRADFADGSDWRRAPAGPATAGGPLVSPTIGPTPSAASRSPSPRASTCSPPRRSTGADQPRPEAGRARGRDRRRARRARPARAGDGLDDGDPEHRGDRASSSRASRAAGRFPKVGRDWAASRALRPLFLAGSAALRARLPGLIRARAPQLGVWAVWVYHPLITARMVAAARSVDVEVIAWTVDDAARVDELRRLGVGGICSNDPRLLR